MELRQLEYFKKIVDCGSISAAARVFHMSQPPLSYQMKQLESELGVTLFLRGSRHIELTQASMVLYRRAEDMLNLAASATREVADAGSKTTFRLGMTPTNSIPMVALLSRFATQQNIRYEIYDGNTFRQKELLESRLIEAAVIRTPIDTTGLHTCRLIEEGMVAVRKVNRSLVTGARIHLEDLADEPLILYRRYDEFVRSAFDGIGLNPYVICECDDGRTALQFARSGLGTAIVPVSIAREYEDLEIRRIDAPDLTTVILLAWKEDSDLLRLFREEIVPHFERIRTGDSPD